MPVSTRQSARPKPTSSETTPSNTTFPSKSSLSPKLAALNTYKLTTPLFQGFGHLAWSCKEPIRCGHCGGGHDRRDCPSGTDAKCVDCNGPHPTGDKGCRVWPSPTHNNEYDQPPNTTVEYHEIACRNGGTHQQLSNTGPRHSPDTGATHLGLPNTCQSPPLVPISADLS